MRTAEAAPQASPRRWLAACAADSTLYFRRLPSSGRSVGLLVWSAPIPRRWCRPVFAWRPWQLAARRLPPCGWAFRKKSAGGVERGVAGGTAGEGLLRGASGRWKILGQPFWWSALLGSFVILMLSGGWALVDGSPGRPYLNGMAASWWLAGLTYLLALGRHRSGMLGLAPPLFSAPRGEYRTEPPHPSHLDAPGAALLVPLYLLAGHFFKRREPWRQHARVMSAGGAGLAVVAALLPLSNFEATALIHPWLAASMILAARLWQQPRLLYLTSLLLLSGSTALVSSRELPAEQSGLAWALLAILHTIAALLRGKSGGEEPGAVSMPRRFTRPAGCLPGWLSCRLCSRCTTACCLHAGQWIALNGWLGYQAHQSVVGRSHTLGRPLPYGLRG
jgi:hypothetical protein